MFCKLMTATMSLLGTTDNGILHVRTRAHLTRRGIGADNADSIFEMAVTYPS